MQPIFKIDGVDFSWVLGEGGIAWSRNDLDSDNTQRTLSGELIRSRITVKRKLKISNCKRMNMAQIKALNEALYPPLIEVEFLDPLAGGAYKGTFYGSSVDATMQRYDRETDETYWDGTSFSLTQK